MSQNRDSEPPDLYALAGEDADMKKSDDAGLLRQAMALMVISPLSIKMPATLTATALAQPAAGQTAADDEKKAEPAEPVVTHHTCTIGGEEIAYTATTGMIALKEEDGTKKADVFFVAYTRDGIDDLSSRPVTFAFNGGPGSSSVWLHLGAFGPQRVDMQDESLTTRPENPKPPHRLINNDYSILDVTDLVFIDPVTTGYSRAVPGESDKQYHGIEQDIRAVAEVIRLYTTKYKRWESPKFLAGESYGTTRAAGLSQYLQDRNGMFLNGIILVSSVLHFQTLEFDRANDLPYVVFLPTYTATAWYHRALPEAGDDLESLLDEAREFASGAYAQALFKGAALPDDERRDVISQLARFTGLSEEFIEENNLRVSIWRFTKELLRDQRRTVGRLDSRFQGIDFDAAGAGPDYDPSYSAIQGPYTAALNHYVRTNLQFESDLPYEILTGRVHPWDYSKYENRYVNVADDLRSAMTKNPHLKVLVTNGYYDLATPFHATEYTFAHLGLDESLRDHITMTYYEGGHMMYINRPCLESFKEDVAEFIRATLEAK